MAGPPPGARCLLVGCPLRKRGTGDDTKEMRTAPGLTTMRSPSSAAITASPTVVKVPRPEASGPTHTRCSFTAVIPSLIGTHIPDIRQDPGFEVLYISKKSHDYKYVRIHKHSRHKHSEASGPTHTPQEGLCVIPLPRVPFAPLRKLLQLSLMGEP